MKRGKMKRWLAALLAVIMICGAVPVDALAVNVTNPDETVCACTAACTEESRDPSCPVCGKEGADLSLCAPAAGNPGKNKCVCTEACTEEEREPSCPVCSKKGADLKLCKPISEENDAASSEKPAEASVDKAPGTASGETTAPSEETTEPSGETTDPSEETTEPSGETTDPSEETTEPSGETTDPSGETTDPSGETTDPSGETTEPGEEPTDPTEETTEPSEETTDPSEETTDPTGESTEPTEEQLPEGYCMVFASNSMAYAVPLPTAADQRKVEDIVKLDENGNPKMYVTLRDNNGNVISSTYPGRNPSYTKTINFGDLAAVQLDFTALKEAALEDGIDEGVYYYLDLPKELLPVQEDAGDHKLVDPETPVELFHNGVIGAFGGIYSNSEGAEKPYRLKFNFVDTKDQLDISASFQYNVTVNDALEPETVYREVDFGGAGKLSFQTGEKEEDVACSYEMSVIGLWEESGGTSMNYGSRNTKINWTVTVQDHTGEEEDGSGGAPSLGTTLTLGQYNPSSYGKHGIVDNMPSYVSTSPFSIEVTLANGTVTTLTPSYRGYWCFYLNDANDPIATIDLPDTDSGFEIGKVSSTYSTYSFIAKYLTVTFGHSDGTPVEGVKQWKIKYTTQAYDNVALPGNGYYTLAELAGVKSDGSELECAGSCSRGYGSGGFSSTGRDSGYYADDAFKYNMGSPSYVPEFFETHFTVKQSGGYHGGNYFSIHYYPGTTPNWDYNDTFGRTKYYVCGDAGRDGPLTDTYYDDGLFNEIRIDGQIIEWTSANIFGQGYSGSGTTTAGSMASELAGSSYSDPVLAYQIQKIFPNDEAIRVFRSTSPDKEGKYYYVVLSPEFVQNARYGTGSGWAGYTKNEDVKTYYGSGGTYTRKPGDWMIYVFNTAGRDVYFKLTERLGDFNRNNVNYGGSYNNTVELYNGYAYNYFVPGWSSGYSVIDSLGAEYVTAEKTVDGETVSDDNWIQWTAEIDLSGYGRHYSDRFSRIYVKVPSELSFPGDGSTAGGLNAAYLYCQTSRGSWSIIGGQPNYTSNPTDWEQSGLKQEDGYKLYYWNYGSLALDGYNLDRNDKLHIRFFTRVNSQRSAGSSSWAEGLDCDFALQLFSGDITEKNGSYYGGSSSYSLLTFQSTVKGGIVQPKVSKTVSSSGFVDENGRKMTRLVWNLDADLVDDPSDHPTHRPYFLSGVWSLTDTMKNSTVTREDGTPIEINPGAYTKLFCAENFQGENFGFNIYTNIANIVFTKADLEDAINAENHQVSKSSYNVTATLTYSGDMETGFHLRLSGLKECTHIHLTYYTVTDDLALSQAIDPDDLTQLYHVNLKNGAAGGWNGQTNPVASGEYETQIVAALAVEKDATNNLSNANPSGSQTAEKLDPWEHGWDGKTTRYTIKATVGASQTDYLRITDYIKTYTELTSWDGSVAKTYEGIGDVAALAESIKVSGLTISVKDPIAETTEVVYENGGFQDGWTLSTLTLRKDLSDDVKGKFPGALYQVILKKVTDGAVSPINPGSVVTVTYNGVLDMETVLPEGKTFRQSDHYSGGVMEIVNNLEAARTYGTQAARLMSARGGSVVGDELICDAGSGAVGKALVEKKLVKAVSKQSVENGEQLLHFMIAERTEQLGKGVPVVEFSDTVTTFYNEENLKNLMDLGKTEDESKELLRKLDDLMIRHYMTVQDLGIHYDQASPDQTTEKTKPVYSQTGKIQAVANQEIANGKLLNITLDLPGSNSLFHLKLEKMGYGEVVVFTYDLKINWRDFLNEAEEQGLLENGMMYGKVVPITKVSNIAAEAEEGFESGSESEVSITGMSAGKKVLSNNASSGMAKWQVEAYTGYVKEGRSLTIADTMTPSADKEGAANAAAKATSVMDVKLELTGTDPLVIYENGNLTEAARNAGWKEDNLTVTVEGLSVTAVISNTDAFTALQPEQTYRMTYTTQLDKNAFVGALVEAGLTVADGEYTLENTVDVSRGTFHTTAGESVKQKPTAPVDLTKSAARPENETTSVIWTVTGKTNEVDRTNFVIRDILLDSSGGEILPYTSVAWMTVTLKTGDAEPVEVFNNSDGKAVNRLAEYGAKLEAISSLDGETEGEFAFAADGKYGYALSFDKLAKNTVVTVTYKTVLNVEDYETDTDKALTLKNSANLKVDDGSYDDAGDSETVTVTKVVGKTGKKGNKTETGNDTMIWTIPLDLRAKYTMEQLADVKSVSVVDDLHPGIAYMDGSLKVYQRVANGSTIKRGSELPEDAYALEQVGNQLTIQLLKPAEYPAVEIEFTTEARASVMGLTNVVYLKVDGTSFREETEAMPPVTAGGQSGYISAIPAPEWTPEFQKYLDGKTEMEADTFSFTLTEVQEDGTAVEDAYTETVTNGKDGSIPFATIRYTLAKDGDVHWYKVVENDCEGYRKDIPEHLIQVMINRLSDAYYVTVTDLTEKDDSAFAFHNSSLVEIAGQKVWDDGNNQDGKRPDRVTVRLYAEGKEIDSQEVTGDKSNNWSWSFGKLPKTNKGKIIQYTVLEDVVEAYSTEITGNAKDGFTVKNSYTPGKTSLTVTKIWEDKDNQDGIRPSQVTFKLLANGVVTDKTLTLDEAGNWTGTFTDLDEYAAGEKIVYTVEEEAVDGYTAAVEYDLDTASAAVKNVHEPEMISISGVKIWKDGGNRDGIRPEWILVNLLKNGNKIASVYTVEDKDWKWSFDGLPKFEKGQEIEYTVTEEAVEGYTTEITGSAAEGFTITNRHTPITPPEPVSVEITAEKTLDGKTPNKSQFSFILTDKYDAVVRTAKNKGGKVTFSPLHFTEPGVFVYKLREQKGDKGFVYDTTVYTVTITVTEEEEGFVTTVEYQKNGKEFTGTPLFANKTRKSFFGPKTGDPFRLTMWTTIAAVSAVGLALTVIFGRKRHRGKFARK